MLDAFFNEQYAGNSWFDELDISRFPRFERYKNAFPVIRMDLGTVDSDSFENFIDSMRRAVASAFKPHRYLLEQPGLDPILAHMFEMLDSNTTQIDEEDLCSSIHFLSEALTEYHGKHPMILIDNYDRAASNAFGLEHLKDIMYFLDSFMIDSVNDNHNVEIAYLTGETPVTKISLYDATDNISVKTLFSNMGEDMFGFTESEVISILDDCNHLEKLEEAREWYGGYLFGDSELFNPRSIMQYISRGLVPEPLRYCDEIEPLISSILERLKEGDRRALQSLASGDVITVNRAMFLGYGDIADSTTPLFTLMAMAGYIRAVAKDSYEIEVSIPNNEAKQFFENRLMEAAVLDEIGNEQSS